MELEPDNLLIELQLAVEIGNVQVHVAGPGGGVDAEFFWRGRHKLNPFVPLISQLWSDLLLNLCGPLMNNEILRGVPLFASLDSSDLDYLAENLTPDHIEPGVVLFREGDQEGHACILLDGEVEILKSLGTADERLLAVRGPGTTLGEMSLFSDDLRRTASCRAKTPVEILMIRRQHLDGLLRRKPALAYEMVRTLSRRLEEAENLTIADLRQKNRELQQAYDELAAAQVELVEKERMERELEVARDIQLSLLPRQLPQHEHLDLGLRFVPMRAVGGDFYDFVVTSGDLLGVAVGDVAGHGVPAALFMALTVTLLRAEARRSSDPGEILRAVNRQLLESTDSGMFVTLLYGLIDPNQGEFRYARAGHPLPVFFDDQRQPVELELGIGQPLGTFEDIAIDERTVSVPSGSLLVLYTDGINEAANDQGQQFDEGGLADALRTYRNQSPQQICDSLFEAVQAYSGNRPAEDDLTLLALGIR